jgi:hypothetical protein
MAADDSGPVSDDSQPMRMVDCAEAVDATSAQDNTSSRAMRAGNVCSMDPSSVSRPLEAVFGEMFVGRQPLCQEFVLTGGIDWNSLSHIYQYIKRTDHNRFQVPESVRIDVPAPAIQYSADKRSAFAGDKNQPGDRMFCINPGTAR